MKTVIFLALATTLAGTLAGCGVSYEDRQYAAYQRHTDEGFYDRSYYAVPYGGTQRVYYSRDDYYRHYNGIDG
jgi:hypothetical protein